MYKIVCDNLIIGYEKEIIKKDITFTINESEYVVILGENGAGKTTFLKTFLSLIKPIGGKIIFDGDISKNDIGYLPQQATVKRDFPATNFEIVLSGSLGKKGILSFYNDWDKKNALKKLDIVGARDLKDKSFKELSGGQQQRVLLARALMATNKVLVLDEPVSGLDPQATTYMYKTINELNKKYGITIIMISHDVGEVIKYADKVILFDEMVKTIDEKEYINMKVVRK